MAGFKTWKLARVEVTIGERKRVSPVLEVGEVTEQITVEAAAELLQTEKSSVEAGVGQKQIRDLPLNGRNPLQLVTLAPGMQFYGRPRSLDTGLAKSRVHYSRGTHGQRSKLRTSNIDSVGVSSQGQFFEITWILLLGTSIKRQEVSRAAQTKLAQLRDIDPP